jgi:AAA domain, putative AbiEii toxin, Type IV TA system
VIGAIEALWPPSFEDAIHELGSYAYIQSGTDTLQLGSPIIPGGSGGQEQVPLTMARAAFDPATAEANEELDQLRRRLSVRFYTALLTGRERFALAGDQQLASLQGAPANHLQVLFRDDALRARVRELIHTAFGTFFVLDPTDPGQVRMRLSSVPPPSPAVERGLDEDAIAFHSGTRPLNEQSDGIQCYIGMIVALVSLPLRNVLIDEPEAFLHPPLARRLGAAISDLAQGRDARVVAATHSADFLRGCIESSAPTSIIRLTYDADAGEATARSLTTGELRPLMRDPLLRSTRALEGLFHRAVVIGESDADRAFYDEVNRRLILEGRGVSDAQFVNAQNWSTESRVIGPLRRIGVPAAGVVDIDVLWNPAGEWRPLYRAIGLPDGNPTRAALEATRRLLANDATERAKAKTRGVAGLPSSKRTPFRKLLGDLAQYGLFVVPTGELESWLPELGLKGVAKHEWIVQMLTRLGGDPAHPSYVAPGRGGVWKFVDDIERWVADPQRKGMPD